MGEGTCRGQGCEVPRLRRERRSLSQGSDGWGLIPGPIWPCLASFTPTVEAGNGATVASFGPPLTRRHWASWLWLRPWLASSGVARRGETFKSVAFGCISLHSLSSTRGRDARFPPSRERRNEFAETTHTTNVRAGRAMAQRAFVVNVGRGVAPPHPPPRLAPLILAANSSTNGCPL